ncbi:MAG: cyclic nucleotide-binding domain-containing protein [Alphaproteobacteria bacterium]|nr:cyclic nucleotide-binding domain-containing protein [Alphaproteobacteria bacterium]
MNNLPARTRTFADGEILLEAGYDHEIGYVILSGHVRLRSGHGALVESAAQGEVIGGASVLFGGPQELTAIAHGPVEALAIDRATVSAQLTRNPDAVREMAASLLARLDLVPKAEREAASSGHDSPLAAPGAWSEVRLRPDSSATRSGMPRRGIVISDIPFGIGRKPLRGEQAPRTGIALTFNDSKPYNLSRSHFMIEHGHTALMIRDVGSQLGTVVNGTRIGLDHLHNALPLHIGENGIAAGGADTPFRFVLEIAT